MVGRFGITVDRPTAPRGRYPARAVVDEILTVRATVFPEGHDAVGTSGAALRRHG